MCLTVSHLHFALRHLICWVLSYCTTCGRLLWRIVEECFHARSFFAEWDRVNLRCTKLDSDIRYPISSTGYDFANTLISPNARINEGTFIQIFVPKNAGSAPNSLRCPTALYEVFSLFRCDCRSDTIKLSEDKLVVEGGENAFAHAPGQQEQQQEEQQQEEQQQQPLPQQSRNTKRQQQLAQELTHASSKHKKSPPRHLRGVMIRGYCLVNLPVLIDVLVELRWLVTFQ